ncbi:MAG: hypothetical protein IPM11_01445 [Micropruina sp.]|nr:hypothetical protein [Micropruina sp.]
MENDLLKGLAQLLATAGLGHYSATTAYPPDAVGIFLTDAPETHPEAITLASYGVSDDVDPDSTIGVQVRFRSASATACSDRASALFATLHARWSLTVNGVRIEQVLRRNSAPLGANNQGLFERVDSYYVDVHYPTTHRT